MTRVPAALPSVLAGLLLGTCVTGCGESAPPLPTTTKTVPVVAQRYQHRDLQAWRVVGPEAPAEERAAQAYALAALETQPSRGTPILLALLADPDPSVQLAAIVAAGRLAPPSEALAGALAAFLGSDVEPLRRHARAATGRLGAVAVPVLRPALASDDVRLRWGAVASLAHAGAAGAALAGTVATLAAGDPDPTVRRQARLTLAQLGPAGAAACAAFLRGGDVASRSEAAAALAAAGPDAVPALTALLTDADEVAAALAAGVLADHGPGAAPAVDALVKALAREGPVRFNAAEALMAVGEPARAAVEALREDPEPGIADIARMILARLDEREP